MEDMILKDKVDELKQKRKEKQRQQQEYIDNLKISATNLFKGENGVFFLKFIMNFCGWNEQSIDITPNDLLYKKGKRDVWVAIRNILPPEVVANVEIY